MALRKKTDKSVKPESAEAVSPSEVLTMIPAKRLASILTLDRKTKKATSELAGELGSEIAAVCEKYGTNRKALGMIRVLNRMEPEKLAAFLDHFDYLLDVSGLEKRAESFQRLPLSEPETEVDTETKSESESASVSRPRFGAHGGGGSAVA